ncbi:MAG: prohibitin family protein [Gemmatimonadales bacterium]|jgi:regulator of protease activity HflC (stomatin/prohibitin superfamily)
MADPIIPREFRAMRRPSLVKSVVMVPVAAVLLFAVMLPFSCTTVTDYEVAVLKNPVTGNVGDESFGQGLYFAAPAIFWKQYSKYDTREIQWPMGAQSEIAEALTADQLTITVDASYRYRVTPESAVDLYLVVGDMRAVNQYVYTTYRSALRDAIAELTGTQILSTERLQIAGRVRELMAEELAPKGVEVVRFFVREIQPPPAVRQAIELKLQREQEVQAQKFQTEIVMEQAEQKRQEALGIRDSQNIIGQSLTSAYLSYFYMQTLQEVGQKEGNVIIAPTEGGNLLFTVPTAVRRQ